MTFLLNLSTCLNQPDAKPKTSSLLPSNLKWLIQCMLTWHLSSSFQSWHATSCKKLENTSKLTTRGSSFLQRREILKIWIHQTLWKCRSSILQPSQNATRLLINLQSRWHVLFQINSTTSRIASVQRIVISQAMGQSSSLRIDWSAKRERKLETRSQRLKNSHVL